MKQFNYNSNIFFLVNNFYVYLMNPQNTLVYNFYYNNNYYLEVKNKENQPLNIFFKIINTNNKCYYYEIYRNKNNLIKLKDFNKLILHNNHKDHIIMNEILLEYISSTFDKLDLSLYNENLFNYNLDYNIKNFLRYNWYYYGKNNKFQYFKYIIYKNKTLFNDIYQKINYNLTFNFDKEYSLLFIDDRFDSIFQYILTMFLYSIDNKWNLNIFTTEENKIKYEECLKYFNIEYKINIIKKFENINNYSNLLKSNDFWNKINEKYVLIFQYDSLAFSKFNYKFLNYHYIGAQWPKHIQQIKGIYNGNGGTSLRNVETMKFITEKYNYKIKDEKTPEDKYFANCLFKENLLMNDPNICDDFSFENLYCENSIFGHAIYESINLTKLENYIYNRLRKLLFIS